MTLLLIPLSLAEGSEQLGSQDVLSSTAIYVDILDATQESISWTGTGSVDVYSPDGALVASLPSGQSTAVSSGGAHQVVLRSPQVGTWDLSVVDPVKPGGRVHSYHWYLDGNGYEEQHAVDTSFYSLVPAGGDDFDVVIEMLADGLVGYEWDILANQSGVDGTGAGRSVDCATDTCDAYTISDLLPIYLGPPSVSEHAVLAPEVTDVGFSANVVGEADCPYFYAGESEAWFTFDSNVRGAYHLACDLDGDGVFDLSSDDDLSLNGAAVAGPNTVAWDGTDNAGDVVAAGDYTCSVTVTVGEFHFLALDIESSFQGLRLFQVEADDTRVGLQMYWNDAEIQDQAVTMANGEKGLESPGDEGLWAGDYGDATEANDNARSWGNFTDTSKGNTNLLDTYAWIQAVSSDDVALVVLDPDADDDGDGLSNADEDCIWGTDPFNSDSDGDGFSDGEEVEDGHDPNDPEDFYVEPEPPPRTGAYVGGACAAAPVGGLWLLGVLAVWRRR